MTHDPASHLLSGNTPLVEIDGVFVKLECSNPTGSVKDRIAHFMLQEAAARGELARGATVVEATSGNTGIGLAWICRQLGFKALIFMPEHMSPERARILEALGAEVRLTPRAGSFEGAIAERDRYRGEPGYYVPDQFGNEDNSLCHFRTTGVELLTQLREAGCERLDAFAAGVGTGGTLMGVGRAIKDAFPEARLVAVEPEESAVMSGGPAGDHGIQGIGDGFIPDLVDMAIVDETYTASTGEARAASERIRREHGYCVGISAGANMLAAYSLRDRGLSVATLWPDCSNRYVSFGLEPPSSEEVRCPLQSVCCEKTARLLVN